MWWGRGAEKPGRVSPLRVLDMLRPPLLYVHVQGQFVNVERATFGCFVGGELHVTTALSNQLALSMCGFKISTLFSYRVLWGLSGVSNPSLALREDFACPPLP